MLHGNKSNVLDKSFFARSTQEVAQDLLGSFLCRKIGNTVLKSVITETEAYLDEKDEASHARFGKTSRSKIMFESPGVWYVYLIYGMHNMLNVVTEQKGKAGAVLIRETVDFKGPAKLTSALQIDREFNGVAISPKHGLWIEKGDEEPAFESLPRIGIDYASEKWRKAPLRFKAKI